MSAGSVRKSRLSSCVQKTRVAHLDAGFGARPVPGGAPLFALVTNTLNSGGNQDEYIPRLGDCLPPCAQ